jgi:Fe-S-cluster containining protein
LDIDKKNLAKKKVVVKDPEADQMSCEFLIENDHSCRVYAKRPFECELYPFLLINTDSGLDLAAHLGCPFIIDNINKDEFSQYADFLLEKLAQPEIMDVIKNQKKVFHWYPEVELYKIKENFITST